MKRVVLIGSESTGKTTLARRLAEHYDVEWVPVPVEDAGPPSRIYRVRLEEWLKLARYALYGWV